MTTSEDNSKKHGNRDNSKKRRGTVWRWAVRAEDGNGIVTSRTFLGATTRVTVLLSGATEVQADVASTAAAAMTPGTSVSVTLPPAPVLVAPR